MINTVDKKIVIAIIVFLILFAAGVFYLIYAISPKTGSVSIETKQSTSQTTKPAQAVYPTIPPDMIPISDTTITLTSNGFEPKTITIQPRTQVIFTYNGLENASVQSRDYARLNLGPFHSGTSLTIVFDKPGTYTYYNSFHPTQTGTVIVTK